MRMIGRAFTTAYKLLSLSFIMAGLLAAFNFATTHAALNQQINYQGKLTDSSGVTVADGTYNMRFWLLTSPSIATTSAEWTESLTGSNRVQVTNGLFSVMLGSTSALTSVNFNQTLYLGVEIGGTGSPSWDGEMSPRKILGTVPAAFEADNAATLGGVASTSFLRSDEGDTLSASEAGTLLTVTQSGAGDILNLFNGATERFTVQADGTVGIGTSTPGVELVVDGDFQLTGGLYDNNNTRGTNGMVMQTTGSGIAWVATSSLGFIASTTDSIQPDQVLSAGQTDEYCLTYESTGDTWEWADCSGGAPLFTDGGATTYLTSLTDNLSVGTTSSFGLFTVSTSSSATALAVRQYGSGDILNVFDGATEVLTVLDGGNVGVGDAAPGSVLDVAGDINISDTTTGYKLGDTTLLYASSTNSSTLVGFNAGANLLPSGTSNTAVGQDALFTATSSGYNTAIGYHALYSNASGTDNTAIGYNALNANTTGYDNSALGRGALNANTTGYQNDAWGRSSLYSNTSGYHNSAVGYRSLYANTTGYENVAIGYRAMNLNTTGFDNAVFGSSALLNNVTGRYNTVAGRSAAYYNNAATSTVVVGYRAARGTAAYNAGELTVVGRSALANIQTGAEDNTALGFKAGNANTTGANNIYLGYQAGDNVTTGSNNIILGYDIDAPAVDSANILNIGNLLYGTGIDGTGTTLSSGNVGIGDTTPSALLNIGTGNVGTVDGTNDLFVTDDIELDGDLFVDGTGTSTFAGHLDVEGHSAFGNGGGAIPNTSNIWVLEHDFTLDTDTRAIDLDAGNSFTATANRKLYGVQSIVQADAVVENGFDVDILGFYTDAQVDGSSTVNDATGLYASVDNNASGAATQIDNARAVYAVIENAVNSTITNSYGLYINQDNLGTTTTHYGIYMNNVIDGTQTNAYAFWTREGDMILDGDGDGIAGGTHAGSDLFFGEGQDAAIWYDGTDLNINPQIVGSGDVYIPAGNLDVIGSITNATWAGDEIGDAYISDTLTIGSGSTVADDLIHPDDLLSTGQTDEYCLTYESTGDTWEWYDCTGAGNTFAAIEVDGSAVSANAPTLDFDGTHFTLTESPTDDFDITLASVAGVTGADEDDLSDDTLNSLSQTSLADPNADQIVFWDDSDTQFEFISTLTGLTLTGNTLALDATGDWTGTFDGQEGSYYLDADNLTNLDAGDLSLTNGYVFRGSAGNVAEATSTLFIADDGNVGIGLTNPNVALDVQGATGTVGVRLKASSGSGDARLYIDGSGRGTFYARDNTGTTQLYLASGGHSYFNGGNVGIGTTSPTTRLHVDSGTVDTALTLESTDNLSVLKLTDNGGTAALFRNSTNSGLGLDASGGSTADLFVTTAGNVGVGTTSPLALLSVGAGTLGTVDGTDDLFVTDDIEVDGDGYIAGNLDIIGSITNAAWAGDEIGDAYIADDIVISSGGSVDSTALTDGGTIGFEWVDAEIADNITVSSSATIDPQAITLATGNVLIGDASNNAVATSSLYVNNDGKVGIGTTTPELLFEIVGAVGRARLVDTDSRAIFDLVNDVATPAADTEMGRLNFMGNDDAGAKIAYARVAGWVADDTAGSTDGYLTFYTIDTSLAERMRITSTGQVGIGTTTPDGTLHVYSGSAGDISAVGTVDDLVVEHSAGGGISILTPDTNESRVAFGSPSDGIGALIDWNHNNDLMGIATFNTGGELAFGTDNDAEAMRITSTGNVGIGTTSPSSALHISDIEGAILVEDSDGSARLALRNLTTTPGPGTEAGRINFQGLDDAGNVTGYAQVKGNVTDDTDGSEDGYLSFITSEAGTLTEQMRITSTGLVGIGTTSPSEELHIHAETDADSTLLLTTANTGSAATDGLYLGVVDADQTAYLWNYENTLLQFGTNNAARMTIAADGNVGIGSTSPISKFVVEGTGSVLQHIRSSDNGAVQLRLRSDDTNRRIVAVGDDGVTESQIILGDNGRFEFAADVTDTTPFTIEGGAPNDALWLASTGNLGIGTTSPTAALTVGNNFMGTIDGTDDLFVTDDIELDGELYVDGTGDSRFAGDLEVDGHLTVGDAAINADVVLRLDETFTADASTYGLYNLVDLDVTGAGTNRTHSGDWTRIDANNVDENGVDINARAVSGEVQIDNTSTLNNAYAGYFLIDNNSSGASPQVDAAFGVYTGIDAASGSTIGTGYGLYNTVINAGTLTTYYGIYQHDTIEGTQTNAYAYWTNEGDMILDGDGDGSAGGTHAGSDLFFGEGQDAAIWYDGTDLVIDPDLVGSGVVNVKGDIRVSGNDLFGPTDGALRLVSDTNVNIHLDEDNDGSATFNVVDGGDTNRFNIDESGNVQMDGDLTVSGLQAIVRDHDSPDDTYALVRGDTHVYLDLDDDNDGSGLLIVRDGANTTVAQINESGDIQGDGELDIDGSGVSTVAGRLGVGGASPTSLSFIAEANLSTNFVGGFNNTNTGTNADGIYIEIGPSNEASLTSSNRFINFRSNDGSVAGSVAGAASAVVYNTTSDVRIKEDIRQTHFTIADLLEVKVRDYQVINGPAATTTGFIAQELYDVYPAAVTKGELLPDGTEDRWGVAYGYVTPLIIKGVQDIANVINLSSASTTLSAMTIDADGNVGIGTSTPSHKLHVAGDVAATGFVNVSTRESKEDIEHLSEAEEEEVLDTLLDMTAAHYIYKDDQTEEERLGVIAEESPEDILTADGKGVDLYKYATYIMTGLKQLAEKVEALVDTVTGNQEKIADLEARLETLEAAAGVNTSSGNNTGGNSDGGTGNSSSGGGNIDDGQTDGDGSDNGTGTTTDEGTDTDTSTSTEDGTGTEETTDTSTDQENTGETNEETGGTEEETTEETTTDPEPPAETIIEEESEPEPEPTPEPTPEPPAPDPAPVTP